MNGNSGNISHKRMSLNYTDYSLNPIRTIKSLLGHNCKILSHVPQSVILSNETIPVDITYVTHNSYTDSNKIYYINPATLKPISTNSHKYIGEIEGIKSSEGIVTSNSLSDSLRNNSNDNIVMNNSMSNIFSNNSTSNSSDGIMSDSLRNDSMSNSNDKLVSNNSSSDIFSNNSTNNSLNNTTENISPDNIDSITPKPVNHNLKFVITLDQLPTKTFPVRLFESLKSSVGYFAQICDSPFTSLITPLKYPGAGSISTNSSMSTNSSTSDSSHIPSITQKVLTEHINIYTTGLKLFNSLSLVDNIIPILNTDNIPIDKYSTTAYVLSFRELYNKLVEVYNRVNGSMNSSGRSSSSDNSTNTSSRSNSSSDNPSTTSSSTISPIRGMIFLYADRLHPDVCLWFPTTSYSITINELHSVKGFVEQEINEYIKFNECGNN